jgi:acyl-CoA thioesterase
MLGFEAFTSTDLWTPAGRSLAFGGQVVAQSLMAASHTVENKEMHSQHVSVDRDRAVLTAVLLSPPVGRMHAGVLTHNSASSAKPITYTVERLRDGESYVDG